MAKHIPDAVLDSMLNVVHGPASHIAVTAGQPTNYTDMVSKTLAGQGLASATTLGPGSPDGRAATIQANASVPITATGTADHVVLHNNTDTQYLITTAASQQLSSGGEVDIPQWTHTLRAPTP